MARLLQVKFGGSHRQYNAQLAALQPFADSLPLRYTLGSKYFVMRVVDSEECRAVIKQCGATIPRKQPFYLSEQYQEV